MKYSDFKSKKDRIAFLRAKLQTEADWAKQACIRIYERQTKDEKELQTTRNLNGVGFTGADGQILSSFAEQINKGRFASSPKQMAILFKKMPKYAKQLDDIAQTKRSTA